MPELAEGFRFVEPEPLTETVVAQHAEIDISTSGIYMRMLDLAPEPRIRHWYSINGLSVSNPGVSYVPELDASVQMTAWLETVNWRKGYGPSRNHAIANEVEVNLMTLAKPLDAGHDKRKDYPRRRVSAAVGGLTLFASDLFVIDLKQIDYESATNIITDIHQTLDLIEQTSA